MVRRLYSLLWWIAAPWLPLRLWWRGRREPGYREAIGERFGRYAASASPPHANPIWIHAVSLGETRAAAPLIERIARKFPQAPILLTAMTASGRDAARSLYGDRVARAWLPYDLPFAVDAFLDRFAPRAALLMETELWPNLVEACRARGIPVHLVNARMSARSATGYASVSALTRPTFEALSSVAAQSEADAQRLRALGARDVVVTGNLKFDLSIDAGQLERGRRLRERIGQDRPTWLAASTREGEEALLLDAMTRAALPDGTLLLLVPRHPQRFDQVEALIRNRGLACVRKSSASPVTSRTRVVLGDTMGEMLAYCAAADVAFVGGSLLPLGGQNLIEPIALGLPTLVGQHTFNFAEATQRAIEAGAARRVRDAKALMVQLAPLLADGNERQRMRAAASTFMAAHRGAAQRSWDHIGSRLTGALTPAPPPFDG